MQIELINQPNNDYDTISQILINRGIPKDNLHKYLNLSFNDVYNPELLNEDNLKKGLEAILQTINNNKKAILIVDCDCDGYTSAAVLINYLYCLFPTWVNNKLEIHFHESKQHGLKDCYDYIVTKDFSLVICPDSSSNDYEQHKKLSEQNIQVLVLDHHLASKDSEYAIVINNQLSDYPNKSLSGVGVVWQFCRYIDKYTHKKLANEFLDLVALGLVGDMMSLQSFETKFLIEQGFSKSSIKNPFIEYMIDKNSFPLSKTSYKSYKENQEITAIGAAFFIVPFINAVTRCGTLDEKQLVFYSMLNHKAFNKILSNKRGHKEGEKELLILQSIRTVNNVKNRQMKAEKTGVELLEKRMQIEHMEDDLFLLFIINNNEVAPEIRGLIANKFAAKYQRPCAVLAPVTDKENNIISYEGSMRGYTKNGITSFKKLCEQCEGLLYVEGHDNAAGLGIKADKIQDFICNMNSLICKYCTGITVRKVDYYFNDSNLDIQKIIDIAQMNDFWGQDVDRAYIGIKFKITSDNVKIMKSNTVKFVVNDDLSIIKFNADDTEIEEIFTTKGYKTIEAYCECAINEWNGRKYPQLILCDYDVIDECQYLF